MLVKKFGDFSSLDHKSKSRLVEFREFNDFLEKNSSIKVEDVHSSYLKILNSNGEIDNSFSELDFQVKKVMENTNLAINSVLNFMDEKFVNKVEVVNNYFKNKGITIANELIEGFLEGFFDNLALEYFKISIELSNEGIVGEDNVDIILSLISKQFEDQVGDEVEVSFYLNSN